jgi:hypothetical protein
VSEQLQAQWQKVLSRCGTTTPAAITVELSATELLNVHSLEVDSSNDNDRSCLTEGAWEIQLPDAVPEDHCFHGEVRLN